MHNDYPESAKSTRTATGLTCDDTSAECEEGDVNRCVT
jgi:hypothetical protein